MASLRDRASKRRELRVQHLIDEYRLIAEASNRPFSEDTRRTLERATTEIQLFGSKHVIERLSRWIDAYVKRERGYTSPLVSALRDELRKELDLVPLADAPKALRISAEDEAA